MFSSENLVGFTFHRLSLSYSFLQIKNAVNMHQIIEITKLEGDSKQFYLKGKGSAENMRNNIGERSKLLYNVHNMIMLAYCFARILALHVING